MMPAPEAIINPIVNIDGVLSPGSHAQLSPVSPSQCFSRPICSNHSKAVADSKRPQLATPTRVRRHPSSASFPVSIPSDRAHSHPSAIRVAALPSESVSSSAAKQLAKQTLAEGKLHKARVSKLQIRLRQYKEMRWVDLLPEYGMCVSGRHHHILLSLRAG